MIDIESALRSGKGVGYERWAKVFNVKQLAKAISYLKEHDDMSYETLQAKAAASTSHFNELSDQIKAMEARLSNNGELQNRLSITLKHALFTPNTARQAIAKVPR